MNRPPLSHYLYGAVQAGALRAVEFALYEVAPRVAKSYLLAVNFAVMIALGVPVAIVFTAIDACQDRE